MTSASADIYIFFSPLLIRFSYCVPHFFWYSDCSVRAVLLFSIYAFGFCCTLCVYHFTRSKIRRLPIYTCIIHTLMAMFSPFVRSFFSVPCIQSLFNVMILWFVCVSEPQRASYRMHLNALLFFIFASSSSLCHWPEMTVVHQTVCTFYFFIILLDGFFFFG